MSSVPDSGVGASKLGGLFWALVGGVSFYGAFYEAIVRSKVGAAAILSSFAVICFLSSSQLLYRKEEPAYGKVRGDKKNG